MTKLSRVAAAFVVATALMMPASFANGPGQQRQPFEVGMCGPTELLQGMAAQSNQQIVATARLGDNVLVEVGNGQVWAIVRVGKPISCVVAVGLSI